MSILEPGGSIIGAPSTRAVIRHAASFDLAHPHFSPIGYPVQVAEALCGLARALGTVFPAGETL